jgi:hypothetical protein
MKIIVVYVYPLGGRDGHLELANRFLNTYHAFPPGVDHETVVVCNGGPTDGETEYLFGSLPGLKLLAHDDSGYDIGAYQKAAATYDSDLMVFLGGSSYLKCVGWLGRFAEARERHGDTLFGSMGNRGAVQFGVHPHIRTTGFAMSPALLRKYPTIVKSREQRYPFEHGPKCLTSWIYGQRKTPLVVVWTGEYPMAKWDEIPNGYHNGDQSNLLIGDRMTAPPFYHTA